MKLSVVYLFIYSWSVGFVLADFVVQFTKPVKAILSKTAQNDAIGYDIHSIEGKRSIQKLFKKDCFENAPIYARILLEHEGETLVNVREKLIILELLNRTKVIFLVWYKNFEMAYEDVRCLERQFCETMQLVDPSYH